MRAFFVVSALLELGAGAGLLLVPGLAAYAVLGERFASLPLELLGRIAGAALLALGVICWMSRSSGGREPLGVVAGMLVYNLAVPVILVYGRLAYAIEGLAFWPACIVHTVLAVWCIRCLRTPESP